VVVVRLAGVGSQELSPAIDLVTHCRHVVLVASGPQEAEEFTHGVVPGQDALHMALQLVLGEERWRQVQWGAQAQRLGHVLIELFCALSANRPEHLLLDRRH